MTDKEKIYNFIMDEQSKKYVEEKAFDSWYAKLTSQRKFQLLQIANKS